SPMTSLLHITITNMGIKSDNDQIELVLLAAPTSAAWFKATTAQESEKIETESNKIVEADPTDTRAKDRYTWM
ncbi:29019_t:CDS:2, partial [Gigaspora margarita]